jgi:hypothetical protein
VSAGPLIIQVPRESEVAIQLAAEPPPSLTGGQAVLEHGATDPEGVLESSDVGEIVLAVPSPEALRRDPDAVRRVIERAGTGTEPLVIVVDSAEELREQEIAPVVEATGHTERSVILRIVRNG